MLGTRLVAERAPQRHAPAFADAGVRIKTGLDRECSRAGLKWIGALCHNRLSKKLRIDAGFNAACPHRATSELLRWH